MNLSFREAPSLGVKPPSPQMPGERGAVRDAVTLSTAERGAMASGESFFLALPVPLHQLQAGSSVHDKRASVQFALLYIPFLRSSRAQRRLEHGSSSGNVRG